MRTLSVRILLSVLATYWLAGCVTSVVFKEKDRLTCPPPPPPVCAPGTFSDITLDTSSAPKGFSSHYLTITKVQRLETAVNEYSVAFPKRTATLPLATLRPGGGGSDDHDALTQVRFSAVDRAAIADPVDAGNLSGSVGGGSVSSSGDTMFLAARTPSSVSGDYDLFTASYAPPTLSGPRRTPVSSEIFWDAQPALAPDGQTLYFASDRRGTSGGTDIFVVRRLPDGRWSAPRNVGPGVNTGCDELSPFVSGDGAWLYFSSAGHSTVGGYDLFRAPIRGGQVGNAENLGRPINTAADELFPSAPPGASPDTLLYYSSNQPGSAGFDIYVLHRLPRRGPPVGTTPARTVTLKGTVRDAKGRPVDSARVSIEQRDPPGHKDSTITSTDGNYQFPVEEGHRYDITAGSDSALYIHEEVRIPISDGRQVVTHDVTISDTVTFRVNFPFNNASDPYEFTLDDQGLPSDLRWKDMIDNAADFLKRFNGARGLRFLIVGHTDPVGSDPFNLDLGQRRAEFIRRELVRRGVATDLLSVDTRGESQPLPSRPSEAEEQYHPRLRRVELIRRR